MKHNINKTERIIRVVVGSALIIGGIVVSGTAGIVMAGIGLIPIATGLIGNCPVYSIFNINTCKTQRFH
jgi:uncharacterized membrane protein